MSDVLTLKQLAEHLQLSEPIIYRLLGRGQLPRFNLGGDWRFRRSVVDYWLDLRLVRRGPAELGEMEAEWPGTTLTLSNALALENALLPLRAESGREIISRLLHAVRFPEPVEVEAVMRQVWEREQVVSTATEGGVAFLHTARWEFRSMHRSDLLAVGRFAVTVDFGAADGGLPDVFLLLLARDAWQHLILLAKAARLCRSPGFLSELRIAPAAADVVALVRHTEQVLFSSLPPLPSM